MISEQKSEPTAQIVQNSYHLGHWLFAVGLVATVTFGFMLAITEGIINPNSSDGLGLIVLPVASGLALAIANRRVLWWGAWFALPFLFCISMLISFGGIIIAGSLELKKEPRYAVFYAHFGRKLAVFYRRAFFVSRLCFFGWARFIFCWADGRHLGSGYERDDVWRNHKRCQFIIYFILGRLCDVAFGHTLATTIFQ
jgi:hypothetical protein